MNTSVVVILLGILTNSAKSMIHSLKYLDYRSTQIPNLPEFVTVIFLNDLQIIHCDCETKRLVLKQDWINKATEEDPKFLYEETQMCLTMKEGSKINIEIIKHHLNLTRDEPILQKMGGCEWDDETNKTRGYLQYGFDGEDFFSLDLKTATWVPLNPQAVIFKDNWERDADAVFNTGLIDHICPKLLKKYVRYEERTLKRKGKRQAFLDIIFFLFFLSSLVYDEDQQKRLKETPSFNTTEKKKLPLVSLLQKTSSSPVTCHATGFYPRDRAMLNWTKDGEELHENVDPGEILPNNDRTFQMSVDLDVSSLPSEDWERYECVLKVSGDKDIVTKLDRAVIRTNEKNSTHNFAVVLVVLGVAIFAVVGVVLYRRFRNKNVI